MDLSDSNEDLSEVYCQTVDLVLHLLWGAYVHMFLYAIWCLLLVSYDHGRPRLAVFDFSLHKCGLNVVCENERPQTHTSGVISMYLLRVDTTKLINIDVFPTCIDGYNPCATGSIAAWILVHVCHRCAANIEEATGIGAAGHEGGNARIICCGWWDPGNCGTLFAEINSLGNVIWAC